MTAKLCARRESQQTAAISAVATCDEVTEDLGHVRTLHRVGKLDALLDAGQQLRLHGAQALCLCSAEHTQRVELLDPGRSQTNLKQQQVSRRSVEANCRDGCLSSRVHVSESCMELDADERAACSTQNVFSDAVSDHAVHLLDSPQGQLRHCTVGLDLRGSSGKEAAECMPLEKFQLVMQHRPANSQHSVFTPSHKRPDCSPLTEQLLDTV